VDNHEWLAARFEEHRTHLRSVAYRMLGSLSDADDVVQEAWLRLSRTDPDEVRNLGGWLTTVVARVCLDTLRSRKARREEPMGVNGYEPPGAISDVGNPEQEAELADSVGVALLVVLDTLEPAERLAFVLHDLFAVPFDEIAPIVERSTNATRMLASRARRRVRGVSADATPEEDTSRQRQVVEAFLAASRGGDFQALLALLDPNAIFRADAAGVASGAMAEVRGATGVAETFSGRARATRPALIDGSVGLAWMQGGELRVVFAFTVTEGRVTEIELVADPERLGELDVELLRN
jgi:RNA polymerase sigma-70 factor (ECF subfamily)